MTRSVLVVATATAIAIGLGTLAPVTIASRATAAELKPAAKWLAPPPRTDNLVALEMGVRVENQPERPGELGFVPERALDGNARTMWATLFAPASLTFSFVGRDTALVASVSIAGADATATPLYGTTVAGSRPGSVEIAVSTTSPTAGFVKVASAILPPDGAERAVTLPAPAMARFIRLTFSPPTGTTKGVSVGEIIVREGARTGYTPLLQRHPDLQTLIATGKLTPDPASLAYEAPGASTSSACVAPATAAAVCPESKSVLVVAQAPSQFYPLSAALRHDAPPTQRYFGPGPGDGRVDETIYKRVDYWMLLPDLAADPPTSSRAPTWIRSCSNKSATSRPASAPRRSRRWSRGWPPATS